MKALNPYFVWKVLVLATFLPSIPKLTNWFLMRVVILSNDLQQNYIYESFNFIGNEYLYFFWGINWCSSIVQMRFIHQEIIHVASLREIMWNNPLWLQLMLWSKPALLPYLAHGQSPSALFETTGLMERCTYSGGCWTAIHITHLKVSKPNIEPVFKWCLFSVPFRWNSLLGNEHLWERGFPWNVTRP